MDATHRHESPTRALIASAEELDPDSPEFYDACQELIKQSARRRARAARPQDSETATDTRFGDPASNLETLYLQPTAQLPDNSDELAARGEAHRMRVELDAVRARLTELTSQHDETAAALQATSQEVVQVRAELTNALSRVSDRDATINEMRQSIADRDREIQELQRELLRAEEARAADAAEFIESLAQYRS